LAREGSFKNPSLVRFAVQQTIIKEVLKPTESSTIGRQMTIRTLSHKARNVLYESLLRKEDLAII
jgi:hypothetical protein